MPMQTPAQISIQMPADWVGRGSTRAARCAPLFDYLRAKHPGDVILEGSSLRLTCNRSVVVSDACTGFIDFATGESGNAVDCLIWHLDYTFQDAVTALCEYMNIPTDLPAKSISIKDLTDYEPTGRPPRRAAGTLAGPPALLSGNQVGLHGVLGTARKPFAPPPPLQGAYRQLFAYLIQQRGIPAWLVQKLVDDGLLYQEATHNNMVFINLARTYAEVRGTLPGKPFHGLVSGSDTEGFWWFKPQGPQSAPTAAFVCEGAIDAISLHLLRQRLSLPTGDNPMYCSIGGVANQRRIDMIKSCMGAAGRPMIIAVDNDEAGEKCRLRNPDCYLLTPRRKDWNADLLAMGAQRQDSR